jgi:Rod binding domain-containing protein
MSISPPSDIVLDVVRAADPLRYQEAAGRLRQIAHTAASDAFSEMLGDVAQDAEEREPAPYRPLIQLPFDATGAMTRLRSNTVLTQDSDTTGAGAFRGFEAMALASFVEAMLPQRAHAVFGTGTAGQIWRSMLAEQIGAQMARAGGIGIAEQLAAAHAPASAPAPAAQLGALAADAVVAQAERGFVSAVLPDRSVTDETAL